jgi:hypothetical protein
MLWPVVSAMENLAGIIIRENQEEFLLRPKSFAILDLVFVALQWDAEKELLPQLYVS